MKQANAGGLVYDLQHKLPRICYGVLTIQSGTAMNVEEMRLARQRGRPFV